MSTNNIDVLVVGGGISGLANGVALSRQGLRVRVLEYTSPFGEVGAGLQLAPNCTRILNSWGLLEEVKALGVLPKRIVMKDAVDGRELTYLDLADAERRYGFPYLVMHRSDLHATLLRACQRAGVELINNANVTGFEQADRGAAVIYGDEREFAPVVLAADGLYSTARSLFSDDEPVSSAYVAYRGAIPIDMVEPLNVDLDAVVLYIGPKCHFVQYPLRKGEMFNQVAVFESPKALRGEEDWGTPDELDGAFAKTCNDIRAGLPLMWRDRWWRMFDRDPIMNWVQGRIALTGDADDSCSIWHKGQSWPSRMRGCWASMPAQIGPPAVLTGSGPGGLQRSPARALQAGRDHGSRLGRLLASPARFVSRMAQQRAPRA